MTPEQEQHLHQIKQTFDIWADRKYRAGQKEHGGNLFDMSHEQLLDNAIDECIDQFIYLVSVREKVKIERHISRMNEPTYRETTD